MERYSWLCDTIWDQLLSGRLTDFGRDFRGIFITFFFFVKYRITFHYFAALSNCDCPVFKQRAAHFVSDQYVKIFSFVTLKVWHALQRAALKRVCLSSRISADPFLAVCSFDDAVALFTAIFGLCCHNV